MSSNKPSSSTALVVGSAALGVAAASAYQLAKSENVKKTSSQLWSSTVDPAYQYLLQYVALEEKVLLLSSKSLAQGKVSDDGDTAEITKSSFLSEEDELNTTEPAEVLSITSRSEDDDNSIKQQVLLEPNDIPRSIEATPRKVVVAAKPQSQTPAFIATSIMAILLLAASLVNEVGTDPILAVIVQVRAVLMAWAAATQAEFNHLVVQAHTLLSS